MKLKSLHYIISEHLRQKGVAYYAKRLGLVALIIWWLWPDAAPQSPQSQSAAVVAATQEPTSAGVAAKAWHNTPVVNQDLRQNMTTTQSSLYWDSFNWMMEYGEPLRPRDFETDILKLLIVTDEGARDDKKLFCRNFREKLVVAGKANTHEGIACQRAPADWCRQLEGEKMQCRSKKAEGFAGLMNDFMPDTQSMKVTLNRNLYKLPRF